MAAQGFAMFDTAVGRCAIAWSARGITGVQLPERDDAATRARLLKRNAGAREAAPPPEVAQTIDDIVALTRGERRDLSLIALDMEGVPDFNRRVYEVARMIAPGTTLTYGAIAWSRPAARAVAFRRPAALPLNCACSPSKARVWTIRRRCSTATVGCGSIWGAEARRHPAGVPLGKEPVGHFRTLSIKAPQYCRGYVFQDRAVRIHLADQSQPLKARGEKPRQRVHVGTNREFPARRGPRQRFAERFFGTREAPAHARQGGAVAARKFGGAISEKAATPAGAGNDLVDEFSQQRCDPLVYIGLARKHCPNVRCSPLNVAVDRLQQ